MGEYDRILTTGDGGKGWREQSNRFEGERDRMINNNKGIFFIDDSEGWLFGTDGSIFHTTNGGAEWSRQESRIPLINGHVRETVNGIHFFDKQHGG